MRLTPNNPREFGLNYISQWQDKVFIFPEIVGYDWILPGYPYSGADARIADLLSDIFPSNALFTFDNNMFVTIDGKLILVKES